MDKQIHKERGSVYLHDWADSNWKDHLGKQALMDDFEITDADLKGVKILLASYTYVDYSGDAYVLFEKDSTLFEVNGSHCSCYGLEGQWEPEETTLESVEYRMRNGDLGNSKWGNNEFADELEKVLKCYQLLLKRRAA